MTGYEALDFFIKMMATGITMGVIHIAIFHLPRWE